ncbi:MAG TPA: hypothetical protein VFA57_14285 [Pseudolabrys sp.]|nr:hypothetical protein [Pseudolabrys sp.]
MSLLRRRFGFGAERHGGNNGVHSVFLKFRVGAQLVDGAGGGEALAAVATFPILGREF